MPDLELTRIPIVRLWDQMFDPLQGHVTDVLAERLQKEVLESIAARKVTGVVIDRTGMGLIDSHLCAVFSTMSPEIAVTPDTMGIELDEVETAALRHLMSSQRRYQAILVRAPVTH